MGQKAQQTVNIGILYSSLTSQTLEKSESGNGWVQEENVSRIFFIYKETTLSSVNVKIHVSFQLSPVFTGSTTPPLHFSMLWLHQIQGNRENLLFLFYSYHLQASCSSVAKGITLPTLCSVVRINLVILCKISKTLGAASSMILSLSWTSLSI